VLSSAERDSPLQPDRREPRCGRSLAEMGTARQFALEPWSSVSTPEAGPLAAWFAGVKLICRGQQFRNLAGIEDLCWDLHPGWGSLYWMWPQGPRCCRSRSSGALAWGALIRPCPDERLRLRPG